MSIEQQIEAALRRLPVADDDEERIERAVKLSIFLLSMKLHTSNLVRLQAVSSTTRRQAVTQLHDFADAIDELDRAMSALSITAADKLDHARETLGIKWALSMPQGIRALIWEHYPGAARAARLAAEELTANPGPGERGKRPDEGALALAEAAAHAYTAITGTAPTRRVDPATAKESGPFLELVADLFGIAGIDKAPVTYVRKAVDAYHGSTNSAAGHMD